MKTERAVIFANGEVDDLSALEHLLQPGDYLVAADGGMLHLKALGLMPSVLLGDMDSLPSEDLASLSTAGIQIVQHPAEKDETDLELALQWVIEAGYCEIRIVGALGGRLDHTLANLYMLTYPPLEACDVRMDDGRMELFFIHRNAVVDGSPGDIVSLLPFFGPAEGIRTKGLAYPLNGETLLPYHTRGISNVLNDTSAEINLTKGMLLCIHTRQR